MSNQELTKRGTKELSNKMEMGTYDNQNRSMEKYTIYGQSINGQSGDEYI